MKSLSLLGLLYFDSSVVRVKSMFVWPLWSSSLARIIRSRLTCHFLGNFVLLLPQHGTGHVVDVVSLGRAHSNPILVHPLHRHYFVVSARCVSAATQKLMVFSPAECCDVVR
jgi:hypothetical protein